MSEPAKKLTLRETFDKVKAHLLTQNERAVSPAGSCMYRTEDGKKCAVGGLITDEAYNPSIEHKSVNVVTNPRWPEEAACMRDALVKSGVPIDEPSTLYVLRSLQQIHDNVPVSCWGASIDRLEAELIASGDL